MDPRLMRERDFSALDALLRAVYRNENDYTPRLRRHLELEPEGWLVAERDGTLLGCAGATVMGPVGYVGLVGVDPSYQRQGVARALMDTLITWLRGRGCATILLDASTAGKPLYLGMGFVEEDTVTIWQRRMNAPVALEHGSDPRVTPFQPSDLGELIAFDSACYGAPRDRVIAAYIADDPAMVSVARDTSGAMTGYLLVQAHSAIGGPWMAADTESASALLMDALNRHPGLVEVVMAPTANHEVGTILRRSFYDPTRSLAHMRLGAPLDPTRRQRVYGQAGLSLG